MVLVAIAAAALQGAPHLPNHASPLQAWPSPEDATRVYPLEALRQKLGAKVVIGCTVAAGGALKDCRVQAEEPAGWGFGACALELIPQLRMDAGSVGGTVRIPFRFAPDSSQRNPAEI